MSNIYKQSLNRKQQQFFPPSLDEYVNSDNQVRAIEDYVELLDMVALDFTKASLLSKDGQPAYHPKLLLKIYIYGYLNKIRSSRKLENEIKRNVEMMWLCGGLTPSYKTIADFRKENAKPLKKVFREFVLLCKELELITGELVAVDGAFLRANASKNQLITKRTVVADLKEIDKKIDTYLEKMIFADNEEKKEKNLTLAITKFSNMKTRKAKLDKDLALLEKMGVTQYTRTDPDAKLMVKPAHNLMAYNAQIVVDDTFKFIVATEVSSDNNDYGKLYNMAKEVKEITQAKEITILADTGYYSALEIEKCQRENIDTVVAIPNTQKTQKDRGYYAHSDFTYDKKRDCFICPNQQKLTKSNTVITKKNGTKAYVYRAGSKICNACPLSDKCIPKETASKRVSRIEYSDIVTQHTEKMKTTRAKKLIKKRGAMVEHPFGTIKQTLGWSHFLVRGLEKVSGENALIMFTYNFRRLLNLIGIVLFRKLILALKEGNIDDIKQEIIAYISRFIAYWDKYLRLMRFYVLEPNISRN
jgi:transposase/predicted amino acid-binding ACT domain protein